MIVDLTDYRRGFCDRLRQVTFYATVASLRKDSALYFNEILSEYCPYSFLDLCRMDGFGLKVWTEGCRNLEETVCDFAVPNLEFIRMHKPKDISLSDKNFLELWLNTYQLLKPVKTIEDKVNGLGIGADCLGLHLRFTDKTRKVSRLQVPKTWISEKDRPAVEKAVARILRDQLKQSAGLRKVFLASDDGDAKSVWIQKLTAEGVTVVSHAASFDKKRLRQTQGEDFAVDLFSLARCGTVIGTTTSSVVKTAVWMRGGRAFVFAADLVPAVVIAKRASQYYQRFKNRLRWLKPLVMNYEGRLRELGRSRHANARRIAEVIERFRTGNWGTYRETFDLIEKERKKMLMNSQPLGDGTLGPERPHDQGTVSQACHASKDFPAALLLHLLVREFRPENVLELGTNLGISSAYLALALSEDPKGKLVTLEASPYRSRLARQLHARLDLKSIHYRTGLFTEVLEPALKEIRTVNFIFVDGHHQYQPTLNYFDFILKYASENAVFVFDDIRWSKDMARAWKKIRRYPQVNLSVDLGSIGICLTSRKPHRVHYASPMIPFRTMLKNQSRVQSAT